MNCLGPAAQELRGGRYEAKRDPGARCIELMSSGFSDCSYELRAAPLTLHMLGVSCYAISRCRVNACGPDLQTWMTRS
jgi:hypothetical protein